MDKITKRETLFAFGYGLGVSLYQVKNGLFFFSKPIDVSGP